MLETEEEFTNRVLDLFGEDEPHRFVRSYIAAVKDDTGATLFSSDMGTDSAEFVVTGRFLNELLNAYGATLA